VPKNRAWDIIASIKLKIYALHEAMGEEYGTFSAAVRDDYYCLHEIRNALEDAEYHVGEKPKRRFWYSGIKSARSATKRLEGTWGDDGKKGGDAVKEHWPGIRIALREMDNLLEEVYWSDSVKRSDECRASGPNISLVRRECN
jgi:hypothetical protein